MYHVDNTLALSRLLREKNAHKSLIIAVDFDNTLYDYHGEGHDYSEVIDTVKQAIKEGHQVFIFTANTDHNFVREHCLSLGLGEPQINTNSLEGLFPSRKPFYNLLLDDRAGLIESLKHLKGLLNND